MALVVAQSIYRQLVVGIANTELQTFWKGKNYGFIHCIRIWTQGIRKFQENFQSGFPDSGPKIDVEISWIYRISANHFLYAQDTITWQTRSTAAIVYITERT